MLSGGETFIFLNTLFFLLNIVYALVNSCINVIQKTKQKVHLYSPCILCHAFMIIVVVVINYFLSLLLSNFGKFGNIITLLNDLLYPWNMIVYKSSNHINFRIYWFLMFIRRKMQSFKFSDKYFLLLSS